MAMMIRYGWMDGMGYCLAGWPGEGFLGDEKGGRMGEFGMGIMG